MRKLWARQSLCARLWRRCVHSALPSAAARLALPGRNAVRSRLLMLLDQPLGPPSRRGVAIEFGELGEPAVRVKLKKASPCASLPNTGRTECTRGPSGHGAHGLTAKTRHCAMPTAHKPSDFAARHRGGRNLDVQLPAVAPEAASARPIPAHATVNHGALAWPSSKQGRQASSSGRLYQFLPSSSQAIGRHTQFLVSS